MGRLERPPPLLPSSPMFPPPSLLPLPFSSLPLPPLLSSPSPPPLFLPLSSLPFPLSFPPSPFLPPLLFSFPLPLSPSLPTPSSLPEAACLTRDLWRGLSLCWTLVLCTGLPGLEPHCHPREAGPAFPVLSAVTLGCHGRLPDVCSWVSSTGHDCPPRWAWLCDQVVFWLPQDFKVPVGGARLQ